jgi:hypothetical protein
VNPPAPIGRVATVVTLAAAVREASPWRSDGREDEGHYRRQDPPANDA